MIDAPATTHSAVGVLSRIGFARWIGYLALVDLLLFPYFQAIIVPYSMPLVLAACVFLNVGFKRDHYLALFVVIALAVVSSGLVSIFLPEHVQYAPENIKRVIQFLTSFLYFFYFRWLASRTKLRIGPIVAVFAIWYTALIILFVSNPLGTNELVRGIYGRLVTAGDIVQEHLRFAYCFEDPNTAAYFFLIAISPFLMTGKITRPVWLLLILTTVAVLASQSKGGLIAFVLMLVAAGYRSEEGLRLFLSPRMLVLLSGIALALLLLYASVDTSPDRSAGSSRVIASAVDRLLGDRDIYLQGGSRFQIWSGVLDSLLPYPLGRGYMLLNNREILFPHSDLLRVAFSYGLIALVATLWFFFGRALRFAPLTIPAAMAFFINTLIDEQKLLALFLTLLALCVASSDRRVAALRTPGPS